MNIWPYPRIVAHRGGGKLAPENTLGAIRLGASMGYKGVEFDVMLAGDGTPVLIHDETLERTTNGRGEVAATRYPEIARLDAGSWHGERWRGERVPAFEEAGRLCRELGIWANVEIKPAKGHERATGEAAARKARDLWRGAALPPVLSSFSTEALAAARDAVPGLPRGLLVSELPPDWEQYLRDLACVALHCDHEHLDAPLVARIRAAGYAVLAWTVNEPAIARQLLGWGADCLVTDALDRIGPDFR
ncbi:MAG: glycerophosphodiester phosphodiesterase [Betaproteobacteria bacterium]|nr:glycerophosphodiester phosphodiesterase [Betaproteobacteria bacterium]